MNILIACDSFKDALNATAVCGAIEKGLHLANPAFNTKIFPLADGGEGLSEVLSYHLGLKRIDLEVHDPLFRKISATYNLSEDQQTAFIEMAQAAGLQLLANEERNPLLTSTFGVGQMIEHALEMGAKRIVLGIGGSATNDLGIGMAAALGWQFLDEVQNVLSPIGGNLGKIHSIVNPDMKNLEGIEFDVMSDVKNPLLGASGAAQVYARQKGANDAAIIQLEKGAENLFQAVNVPIEKAAVPGAGAAGGLGFGLMHFLGASLKSGIDTMMDLTHFDQQVAWSDLIITGEGRLDSQTAQGKLIAGIIQRASPKPVIALCGALDASPQDVIELGLKAAFSITPKPCALAEALAATAENLENVAFSIGRMI
jgi:glycerate 2-kinase